MTRSRSSSRAAARAGSEAAKRSGNRVNGFFGNTGPNKRTRQQIEQRKQMRALAEEFKISDAEEREKSLANASAFLREARELAEGIHDIRAELDEDEVKNAIALREHADVPEPSPLDTPPAQTHLPAMPQLTESLLEHPEILAVVETGNDAHVKPTCSIKAEFMRRALKLAEGDHYNVRIVVDAYTVCVYPTEKGAVALAMLTGAPVMKSVARMVRRRVAKDTRRPTPPAARAQAF